MVLPGSNRTTFGRDRSLLLRHPAEETLRRHATRPLAKAVSPNQLRGWYNHRDLLPFVEECIIDETASLEQTVARVMCEMDWWCGQAVQHSLARGA